MIGKCNLSCRPRPNTPSPPKRIMLRSVINTKPFDSTLLSFPSTCSLSSQPVSYTCMHGPHACVLLMHNHFSYPATTCCEARVGFFRTAFHNRVVETEIDRFGTVFEYTRRQCLPKNDNYSRTDSWPAIVVQFVVLQRIFGA